MQPAPAILCPQSWAGLVCWHCHPRHPGLHLGSEKPQSWGSACSSSSHFRRLSLSQPAPCPHHTADTTLISPPSPSPVVPGDPQQDMTPPSQAVIDCQVPHCHQQELPFKRLCCRRWARHRSINHLSCPHCTPFPAELQLSCSLTKRLLFPVPVILTAPHPLSHGPAASWCYPPASVSPPAEHRVQ